LAFALTVATAGQNIPLHIPKRCMHAGNLAGLVLSSTAYLLMMTDFGT